MEMDALTYDELLERVGEFGWEVVEVLGPCYESGERHHPQCKAIRLIGPDDEIGPVCCSRTFASYPVQDDCEECVECKAELN